MSASCQTRKTCEQRGEEREKTDPTSSELSMLRIRTDDCCLVGLSNILEVISRIRRDDCSLVRFPNVLEAEDSYEHVNINISRRLEGMLLSYVFVVR